MNYKLENALSIESDSLPWGSYMVLDESDTYKVKRIEVLPGKRLSYQRHSLREEHWVIVDGIAHITLNGREIYIGRSERMHIPRGVAHRIENPGKEPLVLVEVQLGSYLGEDDIERLQDDYLCS
jgi:mannose-6-phosphate isomerase-like protein (cupin superfamily)